MGSAVRFNPSQFAVAFNRDQLASKVREQADPPVPVEGFTFGVASMTENAPHLGEMHPDGDEALYLISGRAKVVFPDDSEADIEMLPGDGLIVPQGVWHRVDILEPSQIVYLTPGPNNRFRPLTGSS